MAIEVFKLFGSIMVDNDKANKSISDTDKKAEGLAGKFLSAVGTVAKFGTAVVAAAGTAAVALGTVATKAAIDFENQMSNVATLLDGDVKGKIQDLGMEVKNLSTYTGVSSELLTDGLYQVISAFGETADSMNILATASKGAKAGNATVTDSVNLLAAVTKGYGDTSKEAAEKASDLAFLTVKLGKTSFPELASSMGKVIPLASTMKVSQEELFGAMATLTGVTGNTAEVSTQLRATIQGMLQPTTAMTGKIKKLGYENGQAMIESLGLQGTLDKLKESVGGNEIAFSELFGSVEAKNAVLALTGAQAENFTEKTNAMRNAVGATEDAFKKQTDNIKDNFAKLKNAFDIMMIDLGEKFLPVLNNILNWVNDKMPVIQDVLWTTFDVIGETITWLNDIFKTVTSEINISWDTVINAIKTVWETVGQPIIEAITPLINSLKENWEIIWGAVQLYFQATWDMMKIAWETLGKPIFDFIVLVVGTVADFFAERMPAISGFFSQMVTDITTFWNENLKPCFDAIGQFINNVLAPAFKLVFNHIIAPAVDSAFKLISNLWNSFLKPVLVGITDFLTGVFSGNFTKAFSGIVSTVKGIFGGIVSAVKAPLNAVIGLVNKFIGGLNKLQVPDWVPGIGGKGINIPNIPMLAKGTDYFSGSAYGNLAIVGEKGPELVNLPTGSKVNTAKETESLLAGSNGGTFIFQSILNDKVIAETIASASDIVNGKRFNLAERGLVL